MESPTINLANIRNELNFSKYQKKSESEVIYLKKVRVPQEGIDKKKKILADLAKLKKPLHVKERDIARALEYFRKIEEKKALLKGTQGVCKNQDIKWAKTKIRSIRSNKNKHTTDCRLREETKNL